MIARLDFNDVTLRYPLYNSHNLSLRRNLVEIATGGKLSSGAGEVPQITALDSVSFQIRSGDSVGLIGHNGAGKSSLLRTMAGIYTPLSGRVERAGSLATMFEIGAGMDPELSGFENAMRMGMMLGIPRAEIAAKLPDIEAFTELGDFMQLPVRTYSAGMSMRLMFAVATCTRPDILLVDEVFDVGDEAFRERAASRMKDFIQSSQIFVLASHNVERIKQYCNRVFSLTHGVVREIPVSELGV